jgi:hypothetical protein
VAGFFIPTNINEELGEEGQETVITIVPTKASNAAFLSVKDRVRMPGVPDANCGFRPIAASFEIPVDHGRVQQRTSPPLFLIVCHAASQLCTPPQ